MAISKNVEWEVRTGGVATNGGGFNTTTAGTDYSQQDAAQVSYTDLVIGGTNTQLTSAAFPFTAAHVGNIINITSGTNFTVGRYEVISVASNIATMDRAVGTAGATGGNGKLGGGLLTVAGAVAAIDAIGLAGAGNLVNIHIKSGTYSQTTRTDLTTTNLTYIFEGYNASHWDGGTAPLLTTSTNSIHLFGNTAIVWMYVFNVNFSSTAGTPGDGINATGSNFNVLSMTNCKMSGFKYAIEGEYNVLYAFLDLQLLNCEISNCTTDGVLNAYATTMRNCYIHNNTGNGFTTGVSGQGAASLVLFENCIFASNNIGINDQRSVFTHYYRFYNCTIANHTSDGYKVATAALTRLNGSPAIVNTIFYGNGGKGINVPSGSKLLINYNNAYGSNTGGDRPNLAAGVGEITLTASPFVSGSDFSANSTAGGGALTRGAGWPNPMPSSGSTANARNVGAGQHTVGGGGGGGGGSYTF